MKFFRKSEDVTTDMEEMDTENQAQENQEEQETWTVIRLFKSRDLWKPLMVACMLNLIQQFSGINAVGHASPPPPCSQVSTLFCRSSSTRAASSAKPR
jgi:hypothetical protein